LFLSLQDTLLFFILAQRMVKVKVLSSCLLLVSTSVSALDASVWEGMKDPTQASTNDDAIPKHSRKLTTSAAGLVGEIVAIPFQTVPPGFLECDGQALNRDDYPDLYDAIGDLYGLGSVINTFKIPDYRGYALRALDSGAGIDPGRVLGSKQEDMFKTHFHIVPRDGRTPGSIDSNGAGSESGGTPDNDGISSGNFPFRTLRNSDGGGIETRMKNVAVKFIIRAFPVNDIVAQSGVNTLQVCDADGKMQKQIDLTIYWLLVLTAVIAVRLILDVVSYFKEILVKERLPPVVQPSAQINQQPYDQPNRHFKLENAVAEKNPEIEVM
jgi:hypothetical protein